ncbi:MAG TPA: beta-galactosidase GalB [Verrucomicrobiae bacterium]|nr:beta-galactosidase GalB [Verrucomicrobiae bacterium]
MRHAAVIKRFILLLSVAFAVGIANAENLPRERIPLDADWRFAKGDPTNAPVLQYDVRPKVTDVDDNKSADSEPMAAEKMAATRQSILKPWILPTANPFIKEPAKFHIRPEADPESDISYVKPDFDDSSWQHVNLPHDWAIAGPFHVGRGEGVGGGMGRLPSPGIGWYRKRFDISTNDIGRQIFLDVDGAMSYAMVWINGHLAGGWPYGYASWRVDLTPYLNFGGTNQIAIRLDNPSDSSRWYPGGGIYRNVWLLKVNPVHVGQWGTQLTTPDISLSRATVKLKVTVDNDSTQSVEVSVATKLFALDENGRRKGLAVANIAPAVIQITPHKSGIVEGGEIIENPKLWGPPPSQRPNRYLAVTTIAQNGKIVDEYETPFGIRIIKFIPDEGLFVNGEHISIRGVNQHSDLGALGMAFNERAAQRQLEILHEMGCNAIRTSHNPPAPELLELTDRMGFLVLDEIFDCWNRKKTPLDFHLIFPDWHEPDLRAFIRRDRNHPSVFLWSVGNEVGEQYTGGEGAAVVKELCGIVHQEDPTRLATASMNFAKPDMPFPAALDVISLNYQGEGIRDTPEFAGTKAIHTPPQYDAFHEKFPDKLILSSETASTLSARGTYLFPVTDKDFSPVRDGAGGDSTNQFVSAYELYAVDFGASPDKVFAALDRRPFVAGEFVWSGFDYLGEPTPYYSARSSYSGILDLVGFKKDRFYLYQSRWRPDFPMAHILPHWTWPERVGKITPVHVFTSGDEAELFLNGKSLGRKKKGAYEYRLRWDDVIYQPGTLKVVAYKNGKVWATDEVKTAGAPAKLKLMADRDTICADGNDLSFVAVKVKDKNGIMSPRADNLIHFDIKGPGEIVATDNGAPMDFQPFPSHDRKAFNGFALVIVRGKAGQSGTIKLTATSGKLATGTVFIKTTLKKD